MLCNEVYLKSLSIKHPALAIQLQSLCPPALSSKRVEGAPLHPVLKQSSAWIACAFSLGDSKKIDSWLGEHFANRLVLLFQSLQELYYWLSEAPEACLILNPKVLVLCLQGSDQIQEEYLRRMVWDIPGLSLEVWDPLTRFEAAKRSILSIAFQRRAVVNELIHYGRWNWPNLLRRLIRVHSDRSIPSDKSWRGIPVLVCGAGPSLQEHEATLKDKRDYFYLISAGTGVNVLERLGVCAHMAMMVDPFRAQFSRFCLVDHLELMHGAGWRSNYRALDCMSGPRWLLPGSQAYPIVRQWQDQMSDQVELDEGYNVVAMALSCADSLGADSIGLLGVDLAFTGSRLYGAGVQATERYWQGFSDLEEVPIQIEGASGEPVITLPKWLSEGQWLERWSSQSSSQVYRPGHAGLPLPSIPSVPLEEVAANLVQRDYDSWSWSFYAAADPVDPLNRGEEMLMDLLQQIDQAYCMMDLARASLQSHLDRSKIGDSSNAVYWMQTSLPIELEIELDQLQMDLEELSLYPTVLRIWEQCYRRIYECGFDLFIGDQMSWIHVVWAARRLEYLMKGLDQLRGWCIEVQKGHSHGFSEV